MSRTGGAADISAAVAADRQALAVPDAVQASLPDLTDDDAYAALPDAAEVLEIQLEQGGDVAMAVHEWRRRQGKGGRKAGAVNKRSADFQRWALGFGPHPAKTLQRFQARSAEQLAAELGCDKLDAARLQIRCAETMMPYFEGKMPVKVDVTVNGDLQLDLGGFFDPRVAALTGGVGEQLDLLETAEICDFEPVAEGGSE